MTASGLVQVASHSHNHEDMRKSATDVEFEAVHSQKLIAKHLGCSARTFVYPYGRVNSHARRVVRQHYQFDLRIGSALNWSWKPHGQLGHACVGRASARGRRQAAPLGCLRPDHAGALCSPDGPEAGQQKKGCAV